MSLLSPWALLWLGAVPALIWLWRMSAARLRIQIPSLVPFERLLRRAPRRRARLVVNALFWLQLAALLTLAFALAQPVLFRRGAKTTLVIVDTSASMEASRGGPSGIDQATRALLARIAAKRPTDQFFIMTTAPVTPLTPQPTSDGIALAQVVRGLRASDLGGNLATAARIGRALLGADPDATLIVTDEPAPEGLADAGALWVTVGQPLPNAAIVGLDAQGSLCHRAEARVIATIQNFSDEDAAAAVTASQGGRQVAEAKLRLSPRARQAVSLAMPARAEGWIDVELAAPEDGLRVDNHAWIELHQQATQPILLQAGAPALRRTLEAWLGACEALSWSAEASPNGPPVLLITDHEDEQLASSGAALLVVLPASPRPMLTHWTVSGDHPVGSYLAPVDVVAAALNLTGGLGVAGVPVISALVGGRSVPIVVADEREGRRMVSMFLDPSGAGESTPVLLAFFNSLRWLMGGTETRAAGEPVMVSGLKPGPVTVRRPDGSTETVEANGGIVRYDATTLAGRYRFVQGGVEASRAVNFFDPLESNLMEKASTWRAASSPQSTVHGPQITPRRAAYPLANLLAMLILVILLIEWRLYCVRRA